MRKIVVINGHPDAESFNSAIADSYIKAAVKAGAQVRYIAIGQLKFDPNLRFGYRRRMELEPDLIDALETIQWSEHQVWIHPLWWLGMPAIMKGFFDRAFLPGIVFKSNKVEASEGLLKAKTARIITTAGDLSAAVYEDVYRSSGLVQLKTGILQYCGVQDIEYDFIGPIYEMDIDARGNSLKQVSDIAESEAVTSSSMSIRVTI